MFFLKEFAAVCRIVGAACNMHRALLLGAALCACDKREEPSKPAAAGHTDIFGSTTSAPADAAPAAATPDAGTCPAADGGSGCPMLSFMQHEMTTAFAGKNGPEVALLLGKLAARSPAGYSHWASISRDGAQAAKNGDWTAVKAACRACHDQYRAQYLAEHRAEAL